MFLQSFELILQFGGEWKLLFQTEHKTKYFNCFFTSKTLIDIFLYIIRIVENRFIKPSQVDCADSNIYNEIMLWPICDSIIMYTADRYLLTSDVKINVCFKLELYYVRQQNKELETWGTIYMYMSGTGTNLGMTLCQRGRNAQR